MNRNCSNGSTDKRTSHVPLTDSFEMQVHLRAFGLHDSAKYGIL